MRSGPSSHLARPLSTARPGGGESSGDIFSRAASSVDPRSEIARRQIGKRQQQIAQIAFRIDRDRRNAVERGFLQNSQAKPRLAAAGHADANGVRREVLAVVEQRLGAGLLLGQVVRATEVKRAWFVDVGHRILVRQKKRMRMRGAASINLIHREPQGQPSTLPAKQIPRAGVTLGRQANSSTSPRILWP